MSGEKKTTHDPWKAAQPALKTSLQGAEDLYASGGLFKPYMGSLVTPFSGDTTAGMGALRGSANDAMASGALNRPMDFFSSMFDSGGLSQDQQGVADQWRNTASGAELGQTSSVFDDLIRRATDTARTGVDLSISGAGRYGSGQHSDVLAHTLGGITSGMLQDEYGRQLGRQDSARANLAGLGQQGLANQFGASAALPGAYAASQQPSRDLLGLGQMQEAKDQQTLLDEFRRWQEQNTQQQKSVEWLNQIGSSTGALGGTTTQPGPSPLTTLLGGAMGLTSLFGNPFAGMINPLTGGYFGAQG